jgi:hypothetical protein
MTYLFGNLRLRARKNREPDFEFWGRAQNIGVLMGGYPKEIFFFVIWYFYIKRPPPPII